MTMSDERPVTFRRFSKNKNKSPQSTGRTCIVHFNTNKTDTKVRPLTDVSKGRILDCLHLRRCSEASTSRLASICASIPKDLDFTTHGYHRTCYAQFTNVKYIAKRHLPPADESGSGPSTSKRRRTATTTRLLPNDICIICNKQWKNKTKRLVKCLTKTAESSIRNAARDKKDAIVLARVEDVDLVAQEAHYHEDCRKDYLRRDHRHPDRSADKESMGQIEAHAKAFEYICDYIDRSLIRDAQVERMTMLKEKYCEYLQLHYPDYHNPDYKTYKLKQKLQKHFGSKLKFWAPNYRSDLVYSDELPCGQAVETAFVIAASDERRLEEAAMVLRRYLNDGFQSSPEMPWPPSAAFLLSAANKPPDILLTFFRTLLSGTSDANVHPKLSRLASSLSEDVCYAFSHGKWQMPKHLLVGMTVRHVTGSAEIITLLNRLGHSVSYDKILELETAMANTVLHSPSLLPSTISLNDNKVLHFCWDNFDLNEETPTGSNTTHSTHGIVLQETLSERQQPSIGPQQTVARTHQKTVVYQPQELPPCFAKERAEPRVQVIDSEFVNADVTEKACIADFWWTFARNLSTDDEQLRVPGWAGWVSLTGEGTEQKQTTVDYMAPVHHPITENATVQRVLEISQEATKEAGQDFTVVTFDLAVAKKAYNLVWQNDAFRNIIVQLGSFHVICSFMGAVGKMMRGTGFTDIVIQAGVCASGSVEQVLNGKHYNRALRVHKLVLEALERKLFLKFQASLDVEDLVGKVRAQAAILLHPEKESLQLVMDEVSCQQLYKDYSAFKDSVRRGLLGKTAQFWLQYMDMIWLILRFLRATKENNVDLHLACLQDMCPLLFSMDHQHYAKYLSVYFLTLLNIHHTHPGADRLLRQGALSVSRSAVKTSRTAVDQTIEQTINRAAKCHGGIIGFSRNFPAYYRWCVTRHLRGTYYYAAMEVAGLADEEESSHKDVRLSEIRKSENDVQKVLMSFENFACPFDTEGQDARLFCISSGSPAPPEVEKDLLEVQERGRTAFRQFVNDRLIEKSVSFYAPLKKAALKTFATLRKQVKVRASKNKTVEIVAQRNIFGQLLLLSVQNDISLQKALSYPLSPVPWALATSDGMPAKTDKSKLMHALEQPTSYQEPETERCTSVIDGNALLQCLVGLPGTFGEMAKKVFSLLPKTSRVDFITDTYPENSIKASERARRGASDTFLLKGSSTKIPKDWKGFLCNGSNKTEVMKLILSEWKKDEYACKLKDRQVFFTTENVCSVLFSEDGVTVTSRLVPELSSTQEEADTRIILHCCHQAEACQTDGIIVRSPDTDVFMLLMYHVRNIGKTIFFDTGTGNKRRIMNINCLADTHGREKCEALLGLHAFSGSDSTSSFVRKGKLTALKTLEKQPKHLKTFAALGSLEMNEEMHSNLEQYVCCLYSHTGYADVDKLRHDLCWQKFQASQGPLSGSQGTDLSLLPPCRSSLRLHSARSNYQTLIWKTAHVAVPDVPTPGGRGWKKSTSGLEVEWTDGNILPVELADILCNVELKDSEEEEPTELFSVADVVHEEEYEDDSSVA